MGNATSFEGQSGNSIEDAIKDAIAKDPKGDVGTDLFHYRVADLKCDFGGIVEATTYKVKLERVKS
jgi:hypothetical protein